MNTDRFRASRNWAGRRLDYIVHAGLHVTVRFWGYAPFTMTIAHWHDLPIWRSNQPTSEAA